MALLVAESITGALQQKTAGVFLGSKYTKSNKKATGVAALSPSMFNISVFHVCIFSAFWKNFSSGRGVGLSERSATVMTSQTAHHRTPRHRRRRFEATKRPTLRTLLTFEDNRRASEMRLKESKPARRKKTEAKNI